MTVQIQRLDSLLIRTVASTRMPSIKILMAMAILAITRLKSILKRDSESMNWVMLSRLMGRNGLTKMVTDLETIHSETMQISVQLKTEPPISIRLRSAAKMMGMVGLTTGAETNSLVMQRSGMTQMVMVTVTTGAIQLGTLQEIQNGLEFSLKALHHPTNVQILQQPTSIMKVAQRVREIPTKMVSMIFSTTVQNNRKDLMATMMDVHCPLQKPMMTRR